MKRALPNQPPIGNVGVSPRRRRVRAAECRSEHGPTGARSPIENENWSYRVRNQKLQTPAKPHVGALRLPIEDHHWQKEHSDYCNKKTGPCSWLGQKRVFIGLWILARTHVVVHRALLIYGPVTPSTARSDLTFRGEFHGLVHFLGVAALIKLFSHICSSR